MDRDKEESAGYLLMQIFRLRRQQAHARLEELGLYGGQQWVLRTLWHEQGLTQSELAERVHVRPATATRGLRSMERAGLIERRRDPQDARAVRVYVTEAGLALRGDLEATWQRFDEITFAGFAAQEIDALTGYLRRILANLESMHRTSSESPSRGSAATERMPR
ncbi:MAG: MarR family transcriptional regulator [Anaerolineae bacterium]|nr:MarR family transcriptional regulator [Anaerolineae bacterium]